jgi:hypothetical protein
VALVNTAFNLDRAESAPMKQRGPQEEPTEAY